MEFVKDDILIVMRNLLLISALLFSFNGWAYNEQDLAKLKALNACEGCDLSGADLSGVDLTDANLSGANLSDADLSAANYKRTRYCKTQMPWGEVNSGC